MRRYRAAVRSRAHALGQVFIQRCFYLFVGVLALMIAALLLDPTPRGRMLINAINLLIDVSAVAAVGRSRSSFAIAAALAIPAMLSTSSRDRSASAATPRRPHSQICCISASRR